MLMSLILTCPCKTLMVIRETKVKSWLHHITKKQPLLTTMGPGFYPVCFTLKYGEQCESTLLPLRP